MMIGKITDEHSMQAIVSQGILPAIASAMRADETKLADHIKEFMNVTQCPSFGVMVPVPDDIDLKISDERYLEFENPHKLDAAARWKMCVIYSQSRENHRTRGITELLFCMLRSKHSYTNMKGE